MSDNEPTVEKMHEQCADVMQQLSTIRVWGIQKPADLRAKAEVLEDTDDMEFYGTDDPEELYQLAGRIEAIGQRVNE